MQVAWCVFHFDTGSVVCFFTLTQVENMYRLANTGQLLAADSIGLCQFDTGSNARRLV